MDSNIPSKHPTGQNKTLRNLKQTPSFSLLSASGHSLLLLPHTCRRSRLSRSLMADGVETAAESVAGLSMDPSTAGAPSKKYRLRRRLLLSRAPLPSISISFSVHIFLYPFQRSQEGVEEEAEGRGEAAQRGREEEEGPSLSILDNVTLIKVSPFLL